MDSHRDVREHESSRKRIKFDTGGSNIGELCNGTTFPCLSTTPGKAIDISEGTSVDCDSGYEASTMSSTPTLSRHTSNTDPPDLQEEGVSSESFLQTPTHITDQLDTSQDSLEVDDDNASTVSELSGLSDLSGQDWKPMAGSMIWIQQQMQKGVNPRELLSDLGVDYDQIPEYVDDVTIWKIIINMLGEPPRRNKLRHVNTLDDVVRLLKGAQNVIVLTGAGVSVSCGIPDFRSRDGIYSRLALDFPNLPDPQAMFDISYFSLDPRPFFKFARAIYPGKFQPSPCHRFIKLLERHKKLLRNYTQNIDTLEKVANIKNVIECHGSFATATCTKCSHKVAADEIRDLVLSQRIPLCRSCHPAGEISVNTDEMQTRGESRDFGELVASGIMKPDIVFFGEGLPETFHEAMSEDKSKCDLLLVIGSSLKVRPVALIPSSLPSNVPQILINREPLPHCHFDVELMGDCDVIINHLCQMLGSNWEQGVFSERKLLHAPTLLPFKDDDDERGFPLDKFGKKSEPCWEVMGSARCECNSTKTSSLDLDSDSVSCECPSNYGKSISGKSPEGESDDRSMDGKAATKVRHISIDSARDSGIGDNSNFTDLDEEGAMTTTQSNTAAAQSSSRFSDLRGYWQPKLKRSLADRLPDDSFHLVPPNRYIFPGAEVFHDPDEKLHYEEEERGESSSTSADDSSDAESSEEVETCKAVAAV